MSATVHQPCGFYLYQDARDDRIMFSHSSLKSSIGVDKERFLQLITEIEQRPYLFRLFSNGDVTASVHFEVSELHGPVHITFVEQPIIRKLVFSRTELLYELKFLSQVIR